MNLQRITQAENAITRLEVRLGGILERELHAELLDAQALLAEVRHFAVSWDDAAQAEAGGTMSRERAQGYRHASIDRLVQALRPL